MAAQWRVEEDADPELRERRAAQVRYVWEKHLNVPTPPSQLMRWRVRLFCGHIVETRRHCTIEAPTMHGSSSMACTECEMSPAYIVAYEPLGFLDERPVPPPPAAAPPRPTRAQLERRIKELEAQLSRADGLIEVTGRAPEPASATSKRSA